LEGTHFSEGRGTTRSLEVIGAAEIDFTKVHELMKKKAPKFMKSVANGCIVRDCFFEPTFHKYQKQLCSGLQFHTDFPGYRPEHTKIFRLVALAIKCVRELYPEYEVYRDFAYEYVENKLPFDVINGGSKLRNWIENSSEKFEALDKALSIDEKAWLKTAKKFYLYK
jgi:uncharacterized protein YbbC (DUF1343 family)